MTKKNKISLNEFEFRKPLGWFRQQFRRFVGMNFYSTPPVSYKSWKKLIALPKINDLGMAIGLDSPSIQSSLNYYSKQGNAGKILLIYVLLITIIVLPFLLSGQLFLLSITSSGTEFTVLYIMMNLVFVLLGTRVAEVIVLRQFAEFLCVQESIYILIELSRNDCLSNPENKKSLIERINRLKANTRLIWHIYSDGEDANSSWARNFFEKIALFINLKTQQTIATTDSTLIELRGEFRQLAEMYITGKYGADVGKNKIRDTQNISEAKPEKRKENFLFRLAGIALPLALLSYVLNNKLWITELGINTNNLALLLLSWSLLAIDIAFNLGIVERIINLAKAIRELK